MIRFHYVMNDDILFVGKWLLLAESYPNLLKAPHSNFDRERISKKSGGRVFAFVSTLFIKCILSTYPHSFLFLYSSRFTQFVRNHLYTQSQSSIYYILTDLLKSLYIHMMMKMMIGIGVGSVCVVVETTIRRIVMGS